MKNIKNFIERWKNHGYEKGESQKFWIDLLQNVLGVKNVLEKIFFEQQINGKFIDAVIPSQRVLIEQKSLGKNLSDAFNQAKFYDNELPFNKKSRWIICSDFQTFEIHDMNAPKKPPEIILLENLEKEFYRLNFLIDKNAEKISPELELSLKAGEIVGKLYDALKKNYLNPNSEESLQSLNKLCVRLVFCLYAESSGIFGKHKIFRDYLSSEKNIRRALIDLFEVLNTPEKNRDPYLADELKIFPYVNGGLFADEKIEIPNFTPEIKNLLLEEASSSFNWSGISPTIFGAVFESTLNPVTRRVGGMHYTSQENIHKVIDPLFLEALRGEYGQIKNSQRNRKQKLLDFQKKLSELKFFDPACGSGNFLTESFISLRRLENEILKELLGEKILLGELDNPIKISINQFFGIEINDFAVSVAQTALWIAELQMIQETQEIIHRDLNFLPLKSYANIFEGNALRMDWKNILPNDINFIFGNPPFVANTGRASAKESHSIGILNDEQKADRFNLFGKNGGILDYVACWYKKAADFMKNSSATAAFVSTNSITQGQQVAPLWKPLFDDGIKINFAYQSFKWASESSDSAFVFVVIIGFSYQKKFPCKLFTENAVLEVPHINAYLINAEDIFVEKRSKPINNVSVMITGGKPVEGGNLILSLKERDEIISKNPLAEKFIRPLISGEDFIYDKKRFCLWLADCPPNELRKMPLVLERVKKVREFRLKSSKEQTRRDADRPTEFQEIKPQKNNYIVIPETTSSARKYIPIGFVDSNTIPTNAVHLIPDAELFHFGVLESSVHMAWTKTVCGYFGPSVRYSAQIVYNNFIWCNPSENQRKKIEQTAQKILDVRKNYPESSLADLYDPILMPKDLRDAHKKNDLAVMEAYGFDKNFSENEIVAELMKLYKNLTEK